MHEAMPDALPDAMHVTERTDERTKSLQDPSENVAFLNAYENGAETATEGRWCESHGRSKNTAGVCPGCRADAVSGIHRSLEAHDMAAAAELIRMLAAVDPDAAEAILLMVKAVAR